MATTFHVVNFKNKTIDMITGVSTATTPVGYVNFYTGPQTTDPSVIPTGTFEFVLATSGPNLNLYMSASGGGVTQLAAWRGASVPALALATNGITTARIFTTGSSPLIDVVATLTGGGGGIIIDAMSAVNGVGTIVQAFSLKLPFNNGLTLSLSTSLVDRIVDLWGGGSLTVPEMGKSVAGQLALQVFDDGGAGLPATADEPATGTLLASIPIGTTNIWGSATGGSAALTTNPSVLATASGTATYARLVKNYGSLVFVIQGSAGTSAKDFVLNKTNLVGGVTAVTLTEATISI